MITQITTFVTSKRKELDRFLKFSIVGVIGTVIDFGLFNVLHNIIGVDTILANLMSTSAAVVNNYTWSRYWVYPETRDRQGGKKFLRFVVVSVIAVALNTSILRGADLWLFGPHGLFSGLVACAAAAVGMAHPVFSSNMAKVVATGIVLFWNFFANRMWTFNDVDQVE